MATIVTKASIIRCSVRIYWTQFLHCQNPALLFHKVTRSGWQLVRFSPIGCCCTLGKILTSHVVCIRDRSSFSGLVQLGLSSRGMVHPDFVKTSTQNLWIMACIMSSSFFNASGDSITQSCSICSFLDIVCYFFCFHGSSRMVRMSQLLNSIYVPPHGKR